MDSDEQLAELTLTCQDLAILIAVVTGAVMGDRAALAIGITGSQLNAMLASAAEAGATMVEKRLEGVSHEHN